MSKRKMSIFVVAMLVGIVGWRVPLLPFTPVFLVKRQGHDQKLCYAKMSLDGETSTRISNVLSYYGEFYFHVGKCVLIPLSTLLDKDLLRNYTEKANFVLPWNGFRKCERRGIWVECAVGR